MSELTDEQLREAARVWGQRGAAQRRIVTAACSVCGGPATGTTKRRYCSANCKKKAYRQRKGR